MAKKRQTKSALNGQFKTSSRPTVTVNTTILSSHGRTESFASHASHFERWWGAKCWLTSGTNTPDTIAQSGPERLAANRQ